MRWIYQYSGRKIDMMIKKSICPRMVVPQDGNIAFLNLHTSEKQPQVLEYITQLTARGNSP